MGPQNNCVLPELRLAPQPSTGLVALRMQSSGMKRRRTATTAAPSGTAVPFPLHGLRSLCLKTSSGSVPIFVNRLPGSTDELTLCSLSGALDCELVASALSAALAPGHSIRPASLVFEGLELPGLIVAAGSAAAAAAVYATVSKTPAVVDGELVGLRGEQSAVWSLVLPSLRLTRCHALL